MATWEQCETAAALMGIPFRDLTRYVREARAQLRGRPDDEIYAAVLAMLKADRSSTAVNQARRSIGLIE